MRRSRLSLRLSLRLSSALGSGGAVVNVTDGDDVLVSTAVRTTNAASAITEAGDTVSSAATTTAPAFTPSDLGTALDAWYDPSDLSTMWQDTAGTTPVTADGQAVARIDDKSGNGNHLTQATSAFRPAYKTDGTIRWLLFDTSVNEKYLESATGRTWAASSDVFLSVQTTDTQWAGLRATEAGDEYIFVAQSGNGSTSYSGVGTPTTLVDGSAVSPDTRSNFQSAISSATPKTAEVNSAAIAFGQLQFGMYDNTYSLNGKVYGLLITEVLSSANRTNVRNWLNTKATGSGGGSSVAAAAAITEASDTLSAGTYSLSSTSATKTSASGVSPILVDLTMGSDIFVGYLLRIQRSTDGVKDSDGDYVTQTLLPSTNGLLHQITEAERLAETISQAALIEDGYVEPYGTVYQQYRWERADGSYGPWSQITETISFTPADLFLSAKKGAWYDIDPAYVWQDTAGTVAGAVGSAVARVDDRSGNGNHLTQGTAASQPILRQSGSLYYLEFDGSDDFLTTASGRTWETSSEFLVSLRNANSDLAGTFANASAVQYAFVVDMASAVHMHDGVGTSTVYLNNAQLVPQTRAGFYQQLGSLTPKVCEMRTAAISAWGTLQLGKYSSGDNLNCHWYGGIIHDSANTASRRDFARTWLGIESGLTL